tara:strand:- start:2043 stop:2417 length:375 start_codon:yes stop_codon:yes gene_type:complete
MGLWETKVYRNFKHDDDMVGYRFREVVINHMRAYGMIGNANLVAFWHMLDSKSDFEVDQLISLRKQIEELQIEKYKKTEEYDRALDLPDYKQCGYAVACKNSMEIVNHVFDELFEERELQEAIK